MRWLWSPKIKKLFTTPSSRISQRKWELVLASTWSRHWRADFASVFLSNFRRPHFKVILLFFIPLLSVLMYLYCPAVNETLMLLSQYKKTHGNGWTCINIALTGGYPDCQVLPVSTSICFPKSKDMLSVGKQHSISSLNNFMKSNLLKDLLCHISSSLWRNLLWGTWFLL